MKKLLLFGLASLVSSSAYAQTLAEDKCRHFEFLVENAIGMRDQGIPLDSAIRSIAGPFSDDATDYDVLSISVQSAYQNPGGVSEAIRIGYWRQLCLQALTE